MQYRRAKHKGGCYFFTVNIAERNRSLLVDHLRDCMKKVQQKPPFFIDTIVIWRDMVLSNMIVGLRASAQPTRCRGNKISTNIAWYGFNE